MKLAFLHLSDIHLRDTENEVDKRADKIAAALASADPLIDACVVAITGDIAFSGRRVEYDRAREFFGILRDHLRSRYGDKNIAFFLVPGNHDCDFSNDGDLRSVVLSKLPETIDHLDPDSDITGCLLSVQKEFFNFAAELIGVSDSPKPWLFQECVKSVGDIKVRVKCYNTALASQLSEQQGQLFFPTHVAEGEISADRAITVSLFHHPYLWLNAENAVKFRKHIEARSDLVLTGHMHEQSTFAKTNLTGENINYHEGAVLQDDESARSGFNVIVCDLEQQRNRRFEFGWSGQAYGITASDDWVAVDRNSALRGSFQNNANYDCWLNDPGVGFSHPRKAKLLLSDIFVYPDLSKFSVERQALGRGIPESVLSESVAEFVRKAKKLLILGADQSGRTAFGKVIYRDLQRCGFVPVMLSGPEIKGASDSRFWASIQEAFKQQYSQQSLRDYEQLGREKKALILDDWHRSKLNSAGKARIVDVATRLFDKIVILTGELFRVEEISGLGEAYNPFRSFEFCEIREFGHYLRGRLIERWHSLGREFTWSEADRARETHDTETVISNILGKNLLPSFPVIVLSVLQACESGKAASTPSGSYGYLFEALITSALARVSKDSSELDLRYTFISRLAFRQFSQDQTCLSRHDIEEVKRGYFDEYSIRIDIEDLLGALETAQVIYRSNGELHFRYKYIYYYFVARFFNEGLRNEADRAALQNKLRVMADQIYYQEYASILIFVLYLTKDSELIRYILQNANKTFSRLEPCDFQESVSFINRLYKEQARVLVPSTDVEKNREHYRKELDRAAAESDEALTIKDAKIEYSESLDDITKMNIAVKNLQLLGQVLRNFPGSLRKELKIEITRSCYLLGLRLAHAVFGLAEKNLEAFRNYVAELIRQHRPLLSDQELAKTTDEAVIWLARRAAFGILKTISYAVGLEILEETYREVLETSDEPISFRLIDTSVKLDHFANFPERAVEDLWQDLRKNPFASTLLRDLVAHYLYLFPLDYRKAQHIGSLLEIEINAPQLRSPRTKKLKG
jgi:DNA repair exonuclease SbcCD nuclease subunit